MQATLIVLAASMALTGPRVGAGSESTTSAMIQDCSVLPRQRAQISAEDAGVLVDLGVLEGDRITKTQWIGRIDDREPLLRQRVAEAELEAATEQADSDVNIRFQAKSLDLAQANLDQALSANQRRANSFAPAEVRRRRFEVERARLAIEQAQVERHMNRMKVQVETAELDAAKMSVLKRQIKAPFDGEVVEMFKQVGEWVNLGDPLFRMIRLDEMWVEGFLPADQYLPGEVDRRPVQVTAQITRQRQETFEGYIAFVSPEVDDIRGVFRVKALVRNKQLGGHWMLRAGLPTSMEIDLAAAPIPRRSAARPAPEAGETGAASQPVQARTPATLLPAAKQ